MLSRLSIRARLTAAFAAAMIMVLVLAGVFVYLRVASDLSSSIDDALQTRTNTLIALISKDGPPQLQSGRFAGGEEAFTQVLAPNGRVVDSTLKRRVGTPLTRDEIAIAAGGQEVKVDSRDVQGVEGATRIVARPATSPNGSYVAVAGASLGDRDETLAGLVRAFLITGSLSLVLASGLGYLLAGRALRPVERMRRRAAGITLNRSGERLPLPAADDEIHRLGQTLNEMLDRIEASLDRERVFVADASHELRTPLAILRTELDLADRRQRSPEQLRETLRSAGEEVDRLSRLAEDLLVIARTDQGRLPIKREPVKLSDLLERVRARFSGRAAEVGREITVAAQPDVRADLDPMRVEQALGNLVDNALRHGEGEIHLEAATDDGQVVFEVSDEGTGLPRAYTPKAFERFTRADEGRTGGGSGLGLAIVQQVAEAHHGSVAVEDAPGGGALVRFRLDGHNGA